MICLKYNLKYNIATTYEKILYFGSNVVCNLSCTIYLLGAQKIPDSYKLLIKLKNAFI